MTILLNINKETRHRHADGVMESRAMVGRSCADRLLHKHKLESLSHFRNLNTDVKGNISGAPFVVRYSVVLSLI